MEKEQLAKFRFTDKRCINALRNINVPMNQQPKAIALISGVLDSMLAAKTVMEQGVPVEGINFFTGFCVEGHTYGIRMKYKGIRLKLIKLT